MEAMRTEVFIGSTKNWETNLSEILDQRNVKSLLYAPRTVIGQAIENHLKNYRHRHRRKIRGVKYF